MSEIFTIPLLVAAKTRNILGGDYKVMYTHNAKLHDGRRIWLNDIWELAQYTYPLTVMINDLKEDQ